MEDERWVIENIIQGIAGPTPGLWVPERIRERRNTARKGPQWVVAASRDFLTGSPATPTEVGERLRRLPFPDVLFVLASLGLITAREPLGGPIYATLARLFISQPELERLVEAIRREQHPKLAAIQVFTHQGILSAIKLEIALGQPTASPSNDLTPIGSFLLDVNDYVAGSRFRLGQGSSDYKALMIEMLPSWDLNNAPELLYALGRVYTMLREIHRSDDARATALKAKLPRSIDDIEFDGLDLDDYIAVVFGIFSRLTTLELDDVAMGRRNTVIEPETFLGETKFPKDRFDRFLANRSRELDTVRDSIVRDKPAAGEELLTRLLSDAEVADMVALRRYPLIRLPDARILCLDLPFIAQLLTEGVFWTALETFNRNDRSDGDSFLSLWGRLFELYGTDLLRHFYPPDSRFLTVDLEYPSGQLDDVLDFGNHIILFEFKASLLTLAARGSRDIKEFETQFSLKFVENQKGERKGIQQLAEAVRAILDADVRFTSERPVIYPVLVCYEPTVDAFWVNWYANEIFAQLVPGGLSDRVRPLTLMSVEGLEMALPYVSSGDFTWQTLFESRFKGNIVDERSVCQAIYDWRNSNNRARRVNDYLKERFDRIMESVLRRYRGEQS